MTGRVTALEVQMTHVHASLAKLDSVPADIARMNAEMVTKDFLTTTLNRLFMALCAAMAAMVAAAGLILHFG